MIEQASLLQQATVVFVIALGGVDITGLPNVASAPNAPYFSTAQSAAALSDVALELGAHSISYVCTPHVAPTWLNTVDAAHLPDPTAGPPGLSATVVGYISLYNEHGNPLPGDQGHAPVRRNPQTGYLSYTVAGLAPGTYQMGLFVAYKGDDTITRLYPLLYTSAGTHDQRLTFVLAPASGVSLAVLPPVYLDLDGSACPAAS
jgi:hypothetical protein